MELSPTARILLVTNPHARRNSTRLINELQSVAPIGWTWTICETRRDQFRFGELEATARQSDLAIAVGGDGTVTDVLTALGDAELPLAILPGGSTNVIAQELAVPSSATGLSEMLAGGFGVRILDAATCNDRLFLHMAGAGFDSRIFDHTNPALKRKVGWFAYLPSAASSLRLPPARFHVETENATFDLTSPMVLVANGSGIIRPSLYVYPGISSSDGWLDLIAVTATQTTAILGILARFMTRSMDRSPHILHARARQVSISAEPAMPVQVDGDVVGMTGVNIRILPQRARLVVPLEMLADEEDSREASVTEV